MHDDLAARAQGQRYGVARAAGRKLEQIHVLAGAQGDQEQLQQLPKDRRGLRQPTRWRLRRRRSANRAMTAGTAADTGPVVQAHPSGTGSDAGWGEAPGGDPELPASSPDGTCSQRGLRRQAR